jgi:hypothetical protein
MTFRAPSQALWGIVSACTAAVNSFIGLAMCRLILGCVEAVFFPAALFYLSEPPMSLVTPGNVGELD